MPRLTVLPSRTEAARARVLDAAGCDVKWDRLTRTLYSTDASIYQVEPLAVAFPRTSDDVASLLRICSAEGICVVGRGGGTGLAGGAVGAGLSVDFSRRQARILAVDPAKRQARVQPGVILDQLNAALRPHGLMFAPDVATASRATIGGMLANNSCGAHSLVYGRSVDHVRSLELALASGEVVMISRDDEALAQGAGSSDHAATVDALRSGLEAIRDRHWEEIERRFPRLFRSNAGYGLDRLGPPGVQVDPIKIVCGSEGTLGLITEAVLDLIPLPAHKGMALLEFDEVGAALRSVPDILLHDPAAVELVDRLILSAGLASDRALGVRFERGLPEAILLVEFFGESEEGVAGRLRDFHENWSPKHPEAAVTRLVAPGPQRALWELRSAGLGLLMSRPGESQAYAFIEDAAVDPANLASYIADIRALLRDEGVEEAGYYAHASVGVIHVKPILGLRSAEGAARLERIARQAAALVLKYHGTITGEHGDGLVRSPFLETLYGPRIMSAFGEIKCLFDPHGLMNPGKIVDPAPMTANLRWGPDYTPAPIKTAFDFSPHAGMGAMAEMCSGVGECRKLESGTMCPSYMATREEKDSTRGRANALRSALSNRGLIQGLEDPALAEAMELCLSCKACKRECPTGVDMARLKAEYLHHRHLARGVPRTARWIAEIPEMLRVAARWPRLANAVSQSRLGRRLAERRHGLDRRIAPPRLAHRTFRDWFRRHAPRVAEPRQGEVMLFVDTWTEFITPEVGMAAVRLLEHVGYGVLCPAHGCCGRTWISQGLLGEARQIIEQTLGQLAPRIRAGTPILGVEPSCILALKEEWPALTDSPLARRLPAQVELVDEFLARIMRFESKTLGSGEAEAASGSAAPMAPLLLHAHCHQKALVGAESSLALLNAASRGQARLLDAGCCGMAGSFGHEHYDVAKTIFNHRLGPAIAARPEAEVVITGFSCRHQIEHHTGRRPKHLLEYAAEKLPGERKNEGKPSAVCVQTPGDW